MKFWLTFVDVMQDYCDGLPLSDNAMIVSQLRNCIADVSDWSAAKQLQLNADKTELLWFCSGA